MTSTEIRRLGAECGFELTGVARAEPPSEAPWYHEWVNRGFAGNMRYLTDHRAVMRNDPRRLLPSAKSVICVGKLYESAWPRSTDFTEEEHAWISRYAWGDDYHDVLRRGLERLDSLLPPHDSKMCVDTAPLLERSFAHSAGLGWIGRNTCLINQQSGSWFFLGELLVSLEIEADAPAPNRCGTCTRCIDACPTAAIVPGGPAGFTLDSRLCISYLTIELRGPVPEDRRPGIGRHVFGCDICQDVCPWNRRAPVSTEPSFAPRQFAPTLARLAGVSEAEFRSWFGGTPVTRTRYTGFLRNVAIAMGNSGQAHFSPHLERLALSSDDVVAEHARWALVQLKATQGRYHEEK
jgi:epoxyqueuosine reductase